MSEKPCACGQTSQPSPGAASGTGCSGGGAGAQVAPVAPAPGPWVVGQVPTPAGKVPRVEGRLGPPDELGAWLVRCGIGRDRYRVPPGLYAVGSPTRDSVVLVTANFKLSFDTLRGELDGRHAWILVLDTHGVNVWCAAGKGTFGTRELAERIASTRLGEIVTHRTVVVPQLGAPGVAAHEVKRETGFRVVYGPVRAADLPAFLDAGMVATPEMRRVVFPLGERVKLIPVEIVPSLRRSLPLAAALFTLSGFGGGYSASRAFSEGPAAAAVVVAAALVGAVLPPALLPWLPGRAFSVKGLWVGLPLVGLVGVASRAAPWLAPGTLALAGWALIVLAVTSYQALVFTGSTTYTSLSGVEKELRVALPLQIGGGLLGCILWLVGRTW